MTPCAPSLRPALRVAWRRARAFSLMEILVVVALLGVLASLVVPNLAGATTPLPREVGRALELDLRRARIESIAAVREVPAVAALAGDYTLLVVATAPAPRGGAPADTVARGLLTLRPTPSANGNGDAYQSWNRLQPTATHSTSAATAPAGLRPPVSASATSCCRSASVSADPSSRADCPTPFAIARSPRVRVGARRDGRPQAPVVVGPAGQVRIT